MTGTVLIPDRGEPGTCATHLGVHRFGSYYGCDRRHEHRIVHIGGWLEDSIIASTCIWTEDGEE